MLMVLKKHYRSIGFLILLGLALPMSVSGQLFCPSNINFENGNLNGWKFDTASNNGSLGISTPVTVSAPLSGRHTLTSGTATDYYGGFPIVDPVGGSYSLKLGNDQVGAEVDRARYTFTIPATVNNYSLIYRYAVVLENPTHISSDQPFFKVRVYDSATGNVMNCASFTYVSQSSLPGFSTSSHSGNHNNGAVVYYKPWSTASLNLTGQAGKTLVVEFTAADCALGAHMGYGYVDVSCGLFAITGSSCNPTSPLSAPPGFQSYTWYNANYTSVVGTGQSITVTTPTSVTQYHVVLTPYPGFGCQDTLTTQLIGSTLAVNAGPDTMLCNNSSITLQPTVTGNAAPFTYTWSPATGLSCVNCVSPVASPATATNYVLTVTDSLGCVKRDTVNVKAKPILATSVVNAVCYGSATGSASASASLGTPPFTYSWNTLPPQTGATATGLAAGTYTVTATDSKGCSVAQGITITQPSRVVASIASKDSVSCNGGNDGKATAAAAGGKSPYTYSWNTSPIKNGVTATGLSAGTFVVTVTDSVGCTDTESVAIVQPIPVSVAISTTAVLCHGGNTGTATVTASGGTPAYTYAVDAGGYGSANILSGLTAGTHIVHVKDAHGCVKDSSIVITEPAALALGYAATQPLCNGATNGTITITASGGMAFYQYAIGGGTFTSAPTFSGLSAGTFVLHVKDANGCTKDSTITLLQPAPLAIAPTLSNVLCNGGSSGSVAVVASGGTPAYTYAINTGSFGAASTFPGLAAGTYAIHVKDTNGCRRDTNVSITQPSILTLGYTLTQPLCNGAANGAISILGNGGTTPYQYALNTGVFGSAGTFSGLSAGSYVLHVMDANGCARDSSVLLLQPAALTATASKTNVTCNGGTNGTASVSVSGGTGPYTYSWTGIAATASSVSGLSAKAYTATVTDAKGCTTTASVTISQPSALAATTSAIGPVCNNGSNGSATISPSGGAAPYTYSWSTVPAQTGATATALASGTYSVTITDGAGCTASFTAIVPVTPPVIVTVVPYWVSCFGGKDGGAKAFAANSTAPYTYAWNTTPVQTGDSAKGLSAGSYTVTVTSAAGCIGTGTVSIQQPPVLDAKIAAQGTCPGLTQGSIKTSVMGGNTPYSYAWSTTPVQTTANLSGLAAGSYFLTVTDNRGCTDTLSATVPLFSLPDIDAGTSDTVCKGSGITLTASGAQTYVWSPAYNLSCDRCAATIASPGTDTTYTVVGTDANGCIGKDSVSVTVIQHIPVSAAQKHTICEGDSVQLGVSGGIAWQWLPPVTVGANSTKPIVSPTVTTTYQVVVTENECFRDTLSQIVEVLPTPTIDLGPDLEAPNGSLIRLNAAVANASSIAWSPEEGLSCNNCFSSELTVHGKASYIAKVTNTLGCAAVDTINIVDVCDDHSFFFANVFTPNGDGANDRFYPQGVGGFPIKHFMIYDRWGEVVFSASNITANDASAGWDGTYKGQLIKPDVYVYVMDALCENGQKVMIRGDITLIR